MKFILPLLALIALTACASDPYTMRDIATTIEQAGKVGKGPDSPPKAKEPAKDSTTGAATDGASKPAQ